MPYLSNEKYIEKMPTILNLPGTKAISRDFFKTKILNVETHGSVTKVGSNDEKNWRSYRRFRTLLSCIVH